MAVLTSASGTESVRPTPTVVGPTIVILVLRPSICHQYIFLDIQIIGTCSMRLVCRFCCWPTSQCQTCTGYRTWYHQGMSMTVMTVDRHRASRLGLGPGPGSDPGSTFLLLTKIRLFLQFLSVQIKKYTTLKR